MKTPCFYIKVVQQKIINQFPKRPCGVTMVILPTTEGYLPQYLVSHQHQSLSVNLDNEHTFFLERFTCEIKLNLRMELYYAEAIINCKILVFKLHTSFKLCISIYNYFWLEKTCFYIIQIIFLNLGKLMTSSR